MIKINRNFLDLSESHRKKILMSYKLEDKLEEKINTTNGSIKQFYEYLKNNLDDILEKDITFIQTTIIPAINGILGNDYFTITALNNNNKQEKVNKNEIIEINKIFNYDNFIKVKKRKYDAYDLVISVNINVCPYCNRQFINTIKPTVTKGGTRPTLDHFLLKSEYPYLALSFWNLVPSCYSCNSQLRTIRDIGLHPYLKGFEKVLHFYTDITDITEFIGNSKKYFTLNLKEYKDTKPPVHIPLKAVSHSGN